MATVGGGISRLSFFSAADGSPIPVPAAQASRVLLRLPAAGGATAGVAAAVCGYWDAASEAYRRALWTRIGTSENHNSLMCRLNI